MALGCGAKGALPKAKTGQQARAAKNAPQGKKSVKPQEAAALREVSKTAQVVAMLQRKGGATLSEIMQKMGCSRHAIFELYAYEFMIVFAASAVLSVAISQIAVEALRRYAL